MGRPGPLVAIVLSLAAAGGAVAVVLHVPPALPNEPLAHARADTGESAAEGPAAPVDVESPLRTLEPTPAPAEIDPGDLGEADEPALALDFTPNRAQVDQLRRMSEEEREAFARQLSFGIGTKELKDPRLRTLVERQMARSEKEQKAALDRMYAAGDAALAGKARDVAMGLRPDDSKKDLPDTIARASRKIRDGTIVDVVVRAGDSPALDRACAAYERIRDRRRDTVLALFELVLATAR
jgi:hypothetical protein